MDNKTRIAEIEEKIKKFKDSQTESSTDEVEKQLEVIAADLEDYETRLSSIQDLIKSRERINSEMEKFEKFTSNDEVIQRASLAKSTRLANIINLLKSFNSQRLNYNRQSEIERETEENYYPFKGVNIMFFLFLEILISLYNYLTTNNFNSILIGFFFITATFVLLIIFRLSEHKNIKFHNNFEVNELETLLKSNPKEDELLVNIAWIKALNHEKQKLDKMINQRLRNVSYETLIEEINSMRAVQEELYNQLDNRENDSSEISPEEYLKLRRELDILKIEEETQS